MESEVRQVEVMREGAAVDLVDVKVCAVDETWSALELVIPVAPGSLGDRDPQQGVARRSRNRAGEERRP